MFRDLMKAVPKYMPQEITEGNQKGKQLQQVLNTPVELQLLHLKWPNSWCYANHP